MSLYGQPFWQWNFATSSEWYLLLCLLRLLRALRPLNVLEHRSQRGPSSSGETVAVNPEVAVRKVEVGEARVHDGILGSDGEFGPPSVNVEGVSVSCVPEPS